VIASLRNPDTFVSLFCFVCVCVCVCVRSDGESMKWVCRITLYLDTHTVESVCLIHDVISDGNIYYH